MRLGRLEGMKKQKLIQAKCRLAAGVHMPMLLILGSRHYYLLSCFLMSLWLRPSDRERQGWKIQI